MSDIEPAKGGTEQPLTAGKYAVWGFAFLCVTVALLILYIMKAPQLVDAHLATNVYYVILVALALTVAFLLFGAMKSFGRYTGKAFGGTLELGGPCVGAALIIGIGVYLNRPQAFDVTIIPQGPGGASDRVHTGRVHLKLAGEARSADVDSTGRVVFAQIPAAWWNSDVTLSIKADDYETQTDEVQIQLSQNEITIPIKKIQAITGFVVSARVSLSNDDLRAAVETVLTRHKGAGPLHSLFVYDTQGEALEGAKQLFASLVLDADSAITILKLGLSSGAISVGRRVSYGPALDSITDLLNDPYAEKVSGARAILLTQPFAEQLPKDVRDQYSLVRHQDPTLGKIFYQWQAGIPRTEESPSPRKVGVAEEKPVHEVSVIEVQSPGKEPVIAKEPPPPRVEIIPGVAPSPNHVWIPGYWMWNGTTFVWISGGWHPRPRPGAVWVQGRWERRGNGWSWIYGYWR
jgi:hypothetical protein